MYVGSGRENDGSSSEEDSDEEMVADVQKGEHVEPSAVAGENPIETMKTYMESRRLQRGPEASLPEERELHYMRGQLPYSAWCPVCVKARGREDQHKAKESDEQAVVKVSMDCCSVGEMKLLVRREDKSKPVFCHLCKCKGLGDDRIVDNIMGNTKIVMKTDGEPALMQVQDRVVSVRTQPTTPENPPAYDPQASGGAESGVQEVKGQSRATKLGPEDGIGVEITDTMAILEWTIPQAADSISKFLGGDSGRTAHYRVRHNNFMAMCGSSVSWCWRSPRGSNKQVKKKGALEPMFHECHVGRTQ